MATQMRVVLPNHNLAGDGAPDQFSRSRSKSTRAPNRRPCGRASPFAGVYSYRNASAGRIRDAENDG